MDVAPIAGVVFGGWVMCGAPTPVLTRDPKKRLKAFAKRRLCYGEIARMELDIYGGVWTHPETGKVGATLDWGTTDSFMCARWCNVHRW